MKKENTEKIVLEYLKKIPKSLLNDFEKYDRKNLYFIIKDFYNTVNDKEYKKYNFKVVLPILQKELNQKKVPEGPYCQVCGDWIGIWECSCNGGTF